MATYDGSFFDVKGVLYSSDGFWLQDPKTFAGAGFMTRGGVVYWMRGFDENVAVNDYVFWGSGKVDSDARDYRGSAGPVVNIVVHKKVGA